MGKKKEERQFEFGVSRVVESKAGTNLLFQNRIVSEFVPTKLAADFLGISENALRIKVCRGQVPTYRFGRSLRFRVAEIVSLLTKKE